eukprot:TRINITY_DN50464_c0_g1_i1.p1 TRINITY_DN50464_c0_g1~~TRINITY_DN50464_c0_g1_i1.p1  ORF type:complete len:350 (-),score=40.10 TRINITY_DN50464_c0_g1_i1:330-1379(-)
MWRHCDWSSLRDDKHVSVVDRDWRPTGSPHLATDGLQASPQRHEMSRHEQLSRSLARLLRHRAVKAGVELNATGHAKLADVLALREFRTKNFTVRDVLHLVSTRDAKQRFHVVYASGGDLWIRANQGHSISSLSDSHLLRPIKAPEEKLETCVHGTYLHAWASILHHGGLSRMNRNHIHFTQYLPEDAAQVISGMRSDCELAIYVDMASCAAEGITFFRSHNGVILTRGDELGMVPLRHFLRAVRRADAVLLWPPPEERADVPGGCCSYIRGTDDDSASVRSSSVDSDRSVCVLYVNDAVAKRVRGSDHGTSSISSDEEMRQWCQPRRLSDTRLPAESSATTAIASTQK